MRASNARFAIAALALTCVLAGCGVSVTIAGSNPTSSPTGDTGSPPSSGGLPTGGPSSSGGTGGGGTNLPPMSLAQLDTALLTASDVGSGYAAKYHYDTTHATSTGLGAIATVQSGAASCADVVNSFDPIPTAGNVKSANWAFVDFNNTSDGTTIAEWIGSFSGSGAQQALSTLQQDYGSCQGFTVVSGGTTSVGASESMSTDMLGASTNFGSPSTADMILWGSASSTTSQTYAATVVGVFGGNLAAITTFDSSFSSAAALAGQAATAAASKLGGGGSGNAI